MEEGHEMRKGNGSGQRRGVCMVCLFVSLYRRRRGRRGREERKNTTAKKKWHARGEGRTPVEKG